jgi:hypothetical protein
MRKVAASLVLAAAFPAEAAATPSLRVVDRSPLVVVGAKFHPGERVTVKVAGVSRVFPVTQLGSFKANLAGLVGDRCSFQIVAVGSRGDRVVFPVRTECAPASPASPVPSY